MSNDINKNAPTGDVLKYIEFAKDNAVFKKQWENNEKFQEVVLNRLSSTEKAGTECIVKQQELEKRLTQHKQENQDNYKELRGDFKALEVSIKASISEQVKEIVTEIKGISKVQNTWLGSASILKILFGGAVGAIVLKVLSIVGVV